ncbi:MAG: hypothetical protein OXR67_08030 [Chloroflexota bacterium]|nr:hypothetical protein [Chloroflexota bacterium]
MTRHQISPLTIHFECLVGRLFERDYVPGEAPKPWDERRFHLGNARIQAGVLIDQKEQRVLYPDRSFGPPEPGAAGNEGQDAEEQFWQCAERCWHCGVTHGNYAAAANHIRRKGAGRRPGLGRDTLATPHHPGRGRRGRRR